MGRYATAKRREIDAAFEASSGDLRGDVEPAFIEDRKTRNNVVTAELRYERDTIDVRYTIVDPALDDADVARIFQIAYLDVLTSHYWRNKTGPKVGKVMLRMTNAATGSSAVTKYPDPE